MRNIKKLNILKVHWTVKLGRQSGRLLHWQQNLQLYEYENQTLEAFVVPSSLYAKFDCPVARQN